MTMQQAVERATRHGWRVAEICEWLVRLLPPGRGLVVVVVQVEGEVVIGTEEE